MTIIILNGSEKHQWAARNYSAKNRPFSIENAYPDRNQQLAGSPTMSGCRASATAGESQITSAWAANIPAAR